MSEIHHQFRNEYREECRHLNILINGFTYIKIAIGRLIDRFAFNSITGITNKTGDTGFYIILIFIIKPRFIIQLVSG